MKDALKVIIALIFVWCVISAIRPYWTKYWLGKELETASVYGTKKSIGETRKFLDRKMDEKGYDFRGEDFVINKDENNTVSIRITYLDKISFFGFILKELEFTVEKTSFEVRERW